MRSAFRRLDLCRLSDGSRFLYLRAAEVEESRLVLFVGLTYTVGLAPSTLFSAYVFGSATTANKTLAAGTFLLDTDGEPGRIDWESDDVTDQRRVV